MSKLVRYKLIYISLILNFILTFILPHNDYGNGVYSSGFPSPFLYYRSHIFYSNSGSLGRSFPLTVDLLQFFINISLTFVFVYFIYRIITFVVAAMGALFRGLVRERD